VHYRLRIQSFGGSVLHFQPETLPGGFLGPIYSLAFFRGFGSYILGGRIIGLVQLGGRICYWRHYGLGVFQLIYCSETSHTFLPSSDLPSHGVLQCFEAIREEVVLPLIYSSQDLRIVRERASPIAEGIHWIFSVTWSSAWRGFWKPGSSSILYLGGFISPTLYSLICIPDLHHFV
jgi:hypothetical protein